MNFSGSYSEMNSDIAGEALTARAMWEYKSLAPHNWSSSTEGRAFSVTTIAAIVYGLCNNLIISMAIACSVALVFVIWAVLKVMKACDIESEAVCIGILLIFIIPWSRYHFQLFYLYYSLCIIAMCLSAKHYMEFKINGSLNVSKKAVDIILSFCLGFIGMRGMLVVYLPLLFWEVFLFLLEWTIKKRKGNHSILVYSVVNVLVGYIATRYPYSVKIGGSGLSLRNAPHKFINQIIPAIKDCLGYNSQFNIANVLLCIVLVLTVIAIYIIIIKRHKYPKIFLIMGYWLVSLMISIVANSVTSTEVSWRYYFHLYFIIALSIAFLVQVSHKEWKKYIIMGVVLLYALMCFYKSYFPAFVNTEAGTEDKKIIEWMEEQNYNYGYAQFNDANKLTLLKNGTIQIAAVRDVATMQWCAWLTDVTWYVPHMAEKMDTVYIIRKKELERFQMQLERYDDYKLAFETDNYLLFVSKLNHTCLKTPEWYIEE